MIIAAGGGSAAVGAAGHSVAGARNDGDPLVTFSLTLELKACQLEVKQPLRKRVRFIFTFC